MPEVHYRHADIASAPVLSQMNLESAELDGGAAARHRR